VKVILEGNEKLVNMRCSEFPNLLHQSVEVEQLTLDAGKIGHHNIFLLENSLSIHPVVSLEVVECLLRRKAVGIIFEELEVE